MEKIESYFCETEAASKGLFTILNEYGWHKMKSIVDLVNSKTREEMNNAKENLDSKNIAREVISGSILQISYMAIKIFSECEHKSNAIIQIEKDINEIISNNETRSKRKFKFPKQFCIGRCLGDLPIGLVIYAGRNQYNHHDADLLSPVNEVIFDYLYQMYPNPRSGISFDRKNSQRTYYSYNMLCALGWLDKENSGGYDAYIKDMESIFEVTL